MKMNHKANSSRTPLNVLGCQWQGAEKTNMPKSYFMSIESAHKINGPDGTTSISTLEEMDLKLENERRLSEMREQGKQCLMDRDEHNVSEEGAANLLARFHSMQWMRQPHTEPAATTSQPRSLDNYQVNLVPVKHGEEEYFPGTRQQKRSRRSKNIRSKCEVVKLEEVIPAPTEKIPPACYQPMPCNAWAARKGSELFGSRKLSLTIYDPADDPEALFQRAVEESLITLAQEQDRIVSMYSSVPKYDVPVQSHEVAKLRNDTWDGEKGTCIGDGAGDGSWMRDDCSGNRSNECQGKINSITASTEENSKYELHRPENGGYSGRRGIIKAHQGSSYKSGNVPKDHQAKIAYESRDSADSQCLESSYNGPCNQQKQQPRMDAGDCFYNDGPDRDRVEGRGLKKDVKEKFKDVNNKTYFNKYKTDRNSNSRNFRRSYREENKEAELESLGFNKSRTAQYAQRETLRRRQGEDLQSREHPKACGRSERQEKQHPRGGDHYGHDYENSRERHISFSDPLVSSGKNGRLSSQASVESDEDPWLEPDAHIQPFNAKPQRFLTPKQEDNHVDLFVDNTGKTTASPSRAVAKSPTLKSPVKEMELEKASVNAKKDEAVRMEKASQSVKDSATSPGAPCSPGPLEVSSTVEDSVFNSFPDESETMKDMRQQIHSLNCRLKELSTALEETHVDNIAQQPCSNSKTESTVPEERHLPARKTTPTPAEAESQPTSVPLLNLWFQSLSNSLSHPLTRQVVHPLAHPLAHTVTCAPTPEHSANYSQTHAQVHLQAHPEALPQGHTQTHPNQQVYPQAQLNPQVHPQAQFRAPAHSQAHLQVLSQAQSQEHALPRTRDHPQMQQLSQTQEGAAANQPGVQTAPPTLPQALLAHLQQGQQVSNTGMTPELPIHISQYLAQQRQHLAMQGAAAAAAAVSAACPPGCTPNPVSLNWLGLRPVLPHSTGNWLSQGMPPSAVSAAPGMHPAAVSAAQGMHPDPVSAVHAANQAAMASQTNVGCAEVESTGVENPLTALPSAIPNRACTSANAVPADETGASAQMQWFAQMKAFQLQQQQQMMQLSVMPGIHHSLPVQPLPPFVPPAVGVSGRNWVPGPFPGKIPPQYEGDWIISPADEARLGQGLPLVPHENPMQSSQGRYDIQGASNFSDAALSPTGSLRALGLPVPGSLKPARPPAHLVNLKQQSMDAQVDIDSAASIAVDNSFRLLHQAAAQVMDAPGMRGRGSGLPDEPRGRGRLR